MKTMGKKLRAAFLAALLLVTGDVGAGWTMGGGEARAQPYQGHRYAQAQRQVRRERRRQRMRRLRALRMAAWAEQMRARRRANPALFDRGRRGEQILRARVLAIDPTTEALAQARANGFRLGRLVQLGDTGLIMVVLRAPPGMTTQEALDRLQALDPQGVYDFDHVYDPSLGQAGARVAPVARTALGNGAGVKIGMIDAGVAVALSSDAPVVEDDSPLAGIQAAITRRDAEGELIAPEQAITLDEALDAYTRGGAIASGDDDLRGSLEPGLLADLVVLSGDLRATPPERFTTIALTQTWVGGRQAWSA